MTNIIAIVGRPNVGKSTLFNRLCGGREAIVDPTSGVTRDRHYGHGDWNGVEYSVVDTGGYVDNSGDIFEAEIKKQVRLAIDESDIILFVVDVREGLTHMDEDVAKMLRRSKKMVFLVANKVDSYKIINDVHEFHRLGLGEIYSIAAIDGSGTGDMMDAVVNLFEPPKNKTKSGTSLINTDFDDAIEGAGQSDENPDEEKIPNIAVVGRPNAGKSSLVNLLLGKERNIVTPVPGTTRDSINSHYHYFGLDFNIIDTAGIRKKSKVTENVEFYSVMRAIRSIESSDVCILMIDAERGFETQDLNIFSLIEKNHKGVMIVVNKWDLIEKTSNTHKAFEQDILNQIAPFKDVPIILLLSLTNKGFLKLLKWLSGFGKPLQKNKNRRIKRFYPASHSRNSPPASKGKYIRIKYAIQLPTVFPSFAFFCNLPQYLKEPYKRFFENKIREQYDFLGVPMEIYFRKK